ncbi:hypothetical protein [Kribbella sp. NPDC004875]|uniref:hypothetical protein n=1 Tax=Kribbella sp. NPDC004875 TaxID=3364107 RepID=UPI0036D1F858
MAESGQRVPENSPTYREFSRLYDLARQLRPTGVDLWNRELYATSEHGGFDHQTGAIGIHERILREGLSRDHATDSELQSLALAKVLERATHAGMTIEAPGEPNAVQTTQSRGLHDGLAAVRAATDFQAFNRMSGYPPVKFDNTRLSGAYAATNDLIHQVSGPSVDRQQLVGRLHEGPAVMHFDQLAEGVVHNRLQEVAPPEGPDRQAVRRELISTMLHPQWESLAGRSPEAGRQVAGEIGQALNAKVDEIRRRGPHPDLGVQADGAPRENGARKIAGVAREGEVGGGEPPRDATAPTSARQDVEAARFLSGLAPAAGATGRTPSLGDGSRAAARTSATSRDVSPHRPPQHGPGSSRG